ncbi:MAG TPA: prepilin-type N-terminal cleavage/methylation domain-containing protein, partial [Candidatus Eisenbacteria bacterium]
MISNLRKKMKDRRGFNMIELMVVVVIIGILAAIAVPIYSKYAKNARVTEATGRIGDILTAAKSYAIENDSDGLPTTADWPTSCGATNFVGDCTKSQNFGYTVSASGGTLTILAEGD